MKFTIDSKELKEALASLSKFIPAKPMISALDGFVLEAKDKKLTFTASDGEISDRIVIPCGDISEEGETLFVGKYLLNLLKNVPDGTLTFNQTKNESIDVSWATGDSSMSTLTTESYPKMSFPEKLENPLTFDTKTLSDCIAIAADVTADDEMRPVLEAVLIDCTTNGCALVGSDSRRLSVASIPEVKAEQDKQILINGAAAGAIRAQLKGEKVLLDVNSKNLVLSCGNATILCRTMEQKYPNWKQIIPEGNPTVVEADKDKLIQCVNRVATFSNANTKQITLTIKETTLTLDASDVSTQTKAHESMDCVTKDLQNEEIKVGFKIDFFLDGLKNIKDKTVALKIWDPRKACLIKSTENEGRCNYILMPLATS